MALFRLLAVILAFISVLAQSPDIRADIRIDCSSGQSVHYLPLAYHGGYAAEPNTLLEGVTPADFSSYRSFFGFQKISCEQLRKAGAQTLQVRFSPYVSFFGQANDPLLKPELHNLITEGGTIIATAGLLALSLVFLAQGSISLTGASILFATYAALSIAGLLGISLPMLVGHKLADASLWVGVLLLSIGAIDKSRFPVGRYAMVILSVGILASGSGDIIQILAYLGFVPALILLGEVAWQRSWPLKWCLAVSFILLSDALSITISHSGPMMLPLALLAILALCLKPKVESATLQATI